LRTGIAGDGGDRGWGGAALGAGASARTAGGGGGGQLACAGVREQAKAEGLASFCKTDGLACRHWPDCGYVIWPCG